MLEIEVGVLSQLHVHDANFMHTHTHTHTHTHNTQVFADTLEKKQASIRGIQDLVEILSAKDGIKKNGTKDVESR